MNPGDGLRWFATLAPSHIKMGLGRVQEALAKLGHPERTFPAVHVAGTNGKGSTCAILASCLRQRYRTGLATSPHLVRPNERIQIDGVEISDEVFDRRIGEVNALLGAHELTYFEFSIVMTFWHFAKEKIEIAVIETGLGGRLDATTACQPLVCCITPIDFDHMEYLGDTLEKISREKAGILKPGVPAVYSRDSQLCLRSDSPEVDRLEGRDFHVEAHEGRLTFHSMGRPELVDLRLGLRGPHQRQNLALALATLKELPERFSLSDDELREGVRAAAWPGRLEALEGAPTVVLDGAHNPSGARVLAAALETEYPGRTIHLVFGVFADKDSEPMMRTLFPRVAAVHLVPIDSPRSKKPETYEAFARALHEQVHTYPSAEAGLAAARSQAPRDGVVVIAGSLFLIGQLRRTLVR